MLDIKFIRDNKDVVAHAITKKHIALNIDDLVALDDKRKALLSSVETKRAAQNAANEGIASSATPEDRARLIAEMKTVKTDLEKDETVLKDVIKEWQTLMLRVPNIPDMSVPDGNTDADNVEIKVWGEKTQFAFPPKDHVEIMTALNMVPDFVLQFGIMPSIIFLARILFLSLLRPSFVR